MARLAPLDLNNLTPEQQPVADAILSGRAAACGAHSKPGCRPASPAWPSASAPTAVTAPAFRRT